MMKTRMVLFATLALVVAFTATYVPVSLAGNDNELVQKLIDGSPWEGRFGDYPTGTVTVSFTLSSGSFKGELVSITGSPTERTGPLVWLEVKDDKVTFTTPTGVRNELRLVDGKLTGNWTGRRQGWIYLSPKN